MLTDTSLGDAVSVANKLRELIRTQLRLEDVNTHRITVSIGVSAYPDSAIDKDDLINTADVALYAAKHDGRDCIRCYQVDHLPLEDMMEEVVPLSSHIRAVN
jgi:diguanylate cyclase (GGDEF)-like protein